MMSSATRYSRSRRLLIASPWYGQLMQMPQYNVAAAAYLVQNLCVSCDNVADIGYFGELAHYCRCFVHEENSVAESWWRDAV